MVTEKLLLWLNYAYATEISVIHNLEQHILDMEGLELQGAEEIRKQLGEHLALSREHASKVEKCVRSLDGNVSALTLGVSESLDFAGRVLAQTSDDKILRNLIDDYASEHFEMVIYNILISIAQEIGNPEIAEVCREILQDEVDMAGWLNDNLPGITQEYLRSLGQ